MALKCPASSFPAPNRQRRISGAETAAPKWPSPQIEDLNEYYVKISRPFILSEKNTVKKRHGRARSVQTGSGQPVSLLKTIQLVQK